MPANVNEGELEHIQMALASVRNMLDNEAQLADEFQQLPTFSSERTWMRLRIG